MTPKVVVVLVFFAPALAAPLAALEPARRLRGELPI
jgi:hypothetical protein